MPNHTLVTIDLVGYSKRQAEINRDLGVEGVVTLDTKLKQFGRDALSRAGGSVRDNEHTNPGEGAIFIFNLPNQALEFAAHLHELVADFNKRNGSDFAFRVGIATGELGSDSMLTSKHGVPFSQSKRFETAATPGGVLIDYATYCGANPALRRAYEGPRQVAGKTHDQAFDVWSAIFDPVAAGARDISKNEHNSEYSTEPKSEGKTDASTQIRSPKGPSPKKPPLPKQSFTSLSDLKKIAEPLPEPFREVIKDDSRSEIAEVPTSSIPLLDLARAAYGENLRYNETLRNMVEENYKDRRCTRLQQGLLDALVKQGPHKYADIILCGGTSSGKTTAAELLFGIANGTDFPKSRIIYITPTRALAQERHRDWSRKFGQLNPPGWKENVILSTGEDNSSDGALRRGDFLIACIVYEKANVILSAAAKLLAKLTMVVVDELHMIGDIHRGPLLETLLAKVKYEKASRQRKSTAMPPIRTVGITTEAPTADSFAGYFKTVDPQTEMEIAPLRVNDIGCPMSVQHVLVEPISDGTNNFRATPIAKFARGQMAKLDEEAYAAFARRLFALPSETQTRVRIEPNERYLDFLRDWLSANPNGRRLLVFIGSKQQQIKLAQRLKNKIGEEYSLRDRVFNECRMAGIKRHLQQDDTSLAVPVLKNCLPRGVLFHSADLSRGLRAEIETYLSLPLERMDGSEVVISTETLSYGVNLAIDDVAILALDFPASERHQEEGAPPQRLSHCAFSNMCGRAGRLNQADSGPKVYIWPITNFGDSPQQLVKDFYTRDVDAQTSKMFHAEDREAYDRVTSPGGNKAMAPMRFSYPFVRTVLDGLRYIGGAPGMSGAITTPATLDDVSWNFSRHLLYMHEPGHQGDTGRFNESVKLVVEGSMGADFELVKESGGGYKITELGSSIIDTGTEISTLAPLKRALKAFLDEFNDVAMHGVPVEALMLPLLVQNEAHRQVFGYMPEIKSEVAEGENRKELLRWLSENFCNFGFTDEIISGIDRFLAACDAEPRHANCDTRSSKFVHDACLRLFCGLLLWVSGHSIADIHERLRTIGRITGKTIELNANFSVFAERISWKLTFLGNLMRFSEEHNDLRMLQTRIRRLIIRLRLGCAEAALPFLSSSGPGKDTVERRVAHQLLDAGASAKAVCAGKFDVDTIAPGEAPKIIGQVRNFILSSFERLKDEFVFATQHDDDDDIAGNYWDFAEGLIGRLIRKPDSDLSAWPNRSKETLYTRPADRSADEETLGLSVKLLEENDGLRLIGFKVEWHEDKPVLQSVLHWYVRVASKPDEVPPAPEGYTSIIIDFPWLLHSTPVGGDDVRMSPAAFGILLTLLARSFLAEPVVALEILAKSNAAISSEILLHDLYPQLLMKQVPEPIFDAWAGYWDAD